MNLLWTVFLLTESFVPHSLPTRMICLTASIGYNFTAYILALRATYSLRQYK
jgi:hypothetical protein